MTLAADQSHAGAASAVIEDVSVRPANPPPFQRFLDEQRDVVWRFLRASVGAGEADDCFQETFLAALRAYPRLQRDSNLRAWVLTIAHRKALDAHRARHRRPLPLADVALVDGRTQGAAALRDEALWEAVHQLPARQRAAVLLRHNADLAHRDIARVLDCSEDAARQSLHEGLKRLRQEICR